MGGGDLGLGFFIVGDSLDHPVFGAGPIRTSWVVSEDGNEIETRNSRYTLGRRAIERDPFVAAKETNLRDALVS